MSNVLAGKGMFIAAVSCQFTLLDPSDMLFDITSVNYTVFKNRAARNENITSLLLLPCMSKEQGIQYNIVSVLNVQSEKVQLLQGYYLLTYNLFFILVTIHESLIVALECSILRKCMLMQKYCV